MSVPITYRQKMDFGSCVQMVGFPKYGHILFVDTVPALGTILR